MPATAVTYTSALADVVLSGMLFQLGKQPSSLPCFVGYYPAVKLTLHKSQKLIDIN